VSKEAITRRGEGRYAVRGELTFTTVPELWRAGFGEIDGGPIQLDLAGITRVDSAGIALLIELLRAVRKHGGDVSLVHAPPQLMAIATVTGLDTVLPFGEKANQPEN
jgi:phospholipid transport system transporter-binding protein